MKYRIFLCLSVLLPMLYGGNDWSELREKALNRPRRVIIDNDGGDVTTPPESVEATPEGVLKQRMVNLLNREIDTVTYCPGTVGLTTSTRSKVADPQFKCYNKGCKNIAEELIAQGTDSLEIISKFCREHNLELWVSIRVNDVHDYADFPNRLPKFKRENPELIMGVSPRPRYGLGSAFDFASPEVRKRFNDLACEYLENYDLDGICLDFFRNPLLFRSVAYGGKPTAREREDFTASMRQLRLDADRIGRARGKYLLVAVRVPESLSFCYEAGMDVDGWMRDKIIDVLIPGGDRNRLAPLSESIAAAHKYGVKVYPSVDNDRLNIKGDFSRKNNDTLRAKTAAAYGLGADGVFYFNLIFGRGVMPIARRSLDDLKLNNKKYFVRYIRNTVYASFQEEYNVIPNLISTNPLLLVPGKSTALPMEIGDDFTDESVLKHNPQLTLYLKAGGAEAYPLNAAFNGHELAAPEFKDGVYAYPVPPNAVRQGGNKIILALGKEAALKPIPQKILSGKSKALPPWRRLFDVHDFANSEDVSGGSYLIRDTGTGPRQMANLLYPLPDLAGTPFKVGFEMQLQESSAPEAVMVRIANREFVEIITFMPNEVALKYGGKKARFTTNDKFHSYEAAIDNNILTLSADGNELFSAPLTRKVSDPATRMNSAIAIEFMNESSLVIGSLSGPGTGAAKWRNIVVSYLALPLLDCRLDLIFPKK